MKLFTKEMLIEEFIKIEKRSYIPNTRGRNKGSVGNILEDLLGIKENNLPIPNAAEWELKAQRKNSTALITLFHCEPSPRAVKFVSHVLLPNYGWKHKEAGGRYSEHERSFRQTISGRARSDRGFCIKVNRDDRKVIVSFRAASVSEEHREWLNGLKLKVGLGELSPEPYWGFSDLEHKVGTKLLNCFYVQADCKKEMGIEFFHFNEVTMLKSFSFARFLDEIEAGNILVDFDARTGHNHGTKFRLRQKCLPHLYKTVVKVL